MYITSSTTIGLNRSRLFGPARYVQATSSSVTFDRLICVSDE